MSRAYGIGGKGKCKCGKKARPNQGTCWVCHAAFTRAYRKRTPPTAEQKKRQNARRYVNMYIARGKVKRGPCECVSVECKGKIQPHHEDYDKPLEVRWLCRLHHLRFHGKEIRKWHNSAPTA